MVISTKADALRVVKLSKADKNNIFEFMMKDFLHNESLNCSVGLTENDADAVFRANIDHCLKTPISYAMKNDSNEIVGMRLCSVLQRPVRNQENEPCPDFGNWKANALFSFVSHLENQIWNAIPSSWNTLMSMSFISVDKNYGNRGIGKILLEHNMDEIKAIGCQAIVTEATAYKSQQLFIKKLGYIPAYEILHRDWLDEHGNQIFRCTDGTDRAILAYKPL
ncbi:hypothetical protein L596_013249 [Steinernema carpocapsae]|uniref:aralkylamine N-acetyltransferase n=1 Tax=Steinernema carpocapsae TaxID=34508 RepID=A0A4U5NZL2_STECR|nr:hypothetical protein L596_013249 [Steinernema carpocapsae]